MGNVDINTIYSASNPDFGFLGMFVDASFVVKIVILILLTLSIYSWSIIIAKFITIRDFEKKSSLFYKVFWKSETLFDICNSVSKKNDVFSRIFILSLEEYRNANFDNSNWVSEVRDNIAILFKLESYKVFTNFESNINVLASIGSVTPFIGLFGTVWGIMDSFESIGITKNANLSVVAPGIAEALFTTALGLVVTIPAVIAYNKISAKINFFVGQIDNLENQLNNLFYKEVMHDK